MNHLFVLVAAIGLLNGMFSPILPVVMGAFPIWLPSWLPPMVEVVFFGAVLFVAVATVLVAGIPAAVYERVAGRRATDTVSLLIWAGGALLLALPALPRVVSAL